VYLFYTFLIPQGSKLEHPHSNIESLPSVII
jgi:hypothetical protein